MKSGEDKISMCALSMLKHAKMATTAHDSQDDRRDLKCCFMCLKHINANMCVG